MANFVIVNKTKQVLQLRQEYHPLPCLKHSGLNVEVDIDIELHENNEVTLNDNNKFDSRYERILVAERGGGAEMTTLTESLHGLHADEKIYLFPIVTSPYVDMAVGSWFRLHLALSAAGGSVEAMEVLVQEDISLLPATQRIQSILAAALFVPDTAAGFVADTLGQIIPQPLTPVTAPVLEVVSKPSALLSPTGLTKGLGKLTKPIVKAIPVPASVATLPGPIPLPLPFPKKQEMMETCVAEIPIRIRTCAEDGLHPLEVEARKARLSVINCNVGPGPRIATSTSGGGMRAMISSLGFFTALKEMGVLDSVLYQCGLSGSTWSTAKWMCMNENPFVTYNGVMCDDVFSSDVDPQSFDQVDISKLVHTAGIDVLNWESFEKYIPLLVKSRSLLKVYSVLLARKMESTLTDYSIFQNKTLTGKFPIPLCTAAFNDSQKNLHFADYSPFEIGSTYTESYFPINYFQIQNYHASTPPPINELMAVWGSAFYAKIVQIIPDLPDDFKKLLGNLSLLPGAKVVNANYNRLDGKGQPLPLANHKSLYYKDAGIETNTPIQPLLRPERGVNILIVLNCDSTVSETPFRELEVAIPAIKNAIPQNPTFPYVFPATADYPTIVYIPLLKNADYDANFDPTKSAGTFKFTYTSEEATKLFGLAHHLTMQAKDTIWNVIKEKQSV